MSNNLEYGGYLDFPEVQSMHIVRSVGLQRLGQIVHVDNPTERDHVLAVLIGLGLPQTNLLHGDHCAWQGVRR